MNINLKRVLLGIALIILITGVILLVLAYINRQRTSAD